MYLGVDYYPEQWMQLGAAMVDEDMTRMRDSGMNIIRIGEFAWHMMEPVEGKFDFSFFDDVVEKAKRHGLKVMFGTPTATFPAWLAKAHPSILSHNAQGQAHAFGGRREYCFNSPVYREYARRMVKKLIQHYADEPAIIAWQIDNEFGHEGSDQCYCNQCHHAFQAFLRDKFNDDIQALNETYGTIFWGQTYNDFIEIPMPTPTITTHNPALRLDWARFRSHTINEFANIQISAVKAWRGAHQQITHNLFGGFFNVACDQNELVKDLDFVSYDNYPVWGGLTAPIPPAQIAMTLDYIRGLKQKNFWIVEELMGAQGHNQIGYLPRPNQAKLWAHQAMARGCENMLFFRWRGADRGAEQFCLGILDIDNQDNRKLAEVQTFIRDVTLNEVALNSEIHAEVAVLYDYDNIQSWAIQQQSASFDFTSEFMRLYTPFHTRNIMTDVLSVHKDFSKYKVVVLPAMQIMDESLAARLTDFVTNGGVLVAGFRTAIKNRDNNLHLLKNTPALIGDVLGVVVREGEALVNEQVAIVGEGDYVGQIGCATVWRDMIELTTAQGLYRYDDAFYQDKTCVSRNVYGEGLAYVIGAGVDVSVLLCIVDHVATDQRLSFFVTPDGVERVVRADGACEVLLNHSAQVQAFNGLNLKPFGVVHATPSSLQR